MTAKGEGTSVGALQSIVRNSAWSTLAVVASPILQFLFGGLTLRYIGVEATGFSLAVGAILAIAGRFGTCGVGEASLPAIASALRAGDERLVRRLVGVVLAVYGVSSVVAAVVLLACAGPFIRWSQSPVPEGTAFTFIVIACVTHVLAQMNLALNTILRAASRYDLVTMVTTPLSLVSGVTACLLVPLFPSLTTVALMGAAAAAAGVILAMAVTARTVPAVRRPLMGAGELPGLARYGFWLLLTHVFGMLTGGVDDLVITGACGAAVVPPWAIGKRLWLTAHTFLAQHTEHLVPTLGSLRHSARETFANVAATMHWYVVLLAAVGYTFMAWWGQVMVAAVAGVDVAALCQPAILAYSFMGVVFSLLIIPVIVALAEGASRPSFVVSLLANTAQLAAVYVLATSYGAPGVYYAPIAAVPFLLLAAGTTASSIFDPRVAVSRVQPVAVPLILGVTGVGTSLLAPSGGSVWLRMAMGGSVAVGVFAATIGVEWLASVNDKVHRHLVRAVWHTLEMVSRRLRRMTASGAGGQGGTML